MLKICEPGAPIPMGYHPEERARVGLAIGGGVMFGVLWLGSAAAGATVTETGYRPAIAPIVGPVITIGTAGARDIGAALLVLDGVIQAGGAAMLIVGITTTRTRLVPNEAKAHILPMPMSVGT